MKDYREGSAWTDVMELECLLIYKILESEDFPRGKQKKLAEDLAARSDLEWGSISAKVSNFKSVAGKNNHSNASKNTVRLFDEYGDLEPVEIKKLLRKCKT